MKKIITMLLALMIVVSLAACAGKSAPETADSQKPETTSESEAGKE